MTLNNQQLKNELSQIINRTAVQIFERQKVTRVIRSADGNGHTIETDDDQEAVICVLFKNFFFDCYHNNDYDMTATLEDLREWFDMELQTFAKEYDETE